MFHSQPFRGCYPSEIKNGAIRIPDAFDLHGEVVVTTTDTRSISVFPSAAFDRLCDELANDPDHRMRLDIIHFYACQQQIGADRRLLIPKMVGRFVGLSSDVVVLGRIDHITIIDAQRLAEAIAKEPPDSSDWRS